MPEPRALDTTTRLLVTLKCALARPDLTLFRGTAQAGLETGISARVVREVCVQGIAYAGFPRALSALRSVAHLLPPEAGAQLAPPDVAARRGRGYFDAVYGPHAAKLIGIVQELDPVFALMTVDLAYGQILARSDLAPETRELMAVACLSVLCQPAQLVAHAHGALNFGATKAEVFDAVHTACTLFPDLIPERHGDLLEEQLGTRGNNGVS